MAQRLRECADKISNAILNAMNIRGLVRPSDPEYADASEMAGAFAYIRTCLDSWFATHDSLVVDISPEVEMACEEVLTELGAIALPERETAWLWWGSTSTLLGLLETRQYPFSFPRIDLEKILVSVLRSSSNDIRSLKSVCSALLVKLGQGDANTDGMLVPAPYQYISVPELSNGLRDSVFAALGFLSQCSGSESHNHVESGELSTRTSPAVESSFQNPGHPTRLSLQEPEFNKEFENQNITVLITGTLSTPWREFCLMAKPREPILELNEELNQRDFCLHLKHQLYASVFVSFKDDRLWLDSNAVGSSELLHVGPGIVLKDFLCCYELTPRDVIQLSYAVVRSYWEYYDSDLMRVQWTSDTISFMTDENNRLRLPLTAHLSFPLSVSKEPRPEILPGKWLKHRCPRIFDIGVLLLEIGLAEPFPLRYQCDLNLGDEARAERLNRIYRNAHSQMEKLRRTEWKDFANRKIHFDKAVGFCLDSKRFVHENSPAQRNPNHHHVKSMRSGVLSAFRADVREQRLTFHKNVVKPLAWLAKTVADTAGQKRPLFAERKQTFNNTFPLERQASFHTGATIRPDEWLLQLELINQNVEELRRFLRVRRRVRIAILDTGLDRDFLAFKKDKTLLRQVTAEKDFVDSTAETATDTCGHGTLMARLIMECAPHAGVDILVARVAKKKEDLVNSTENIEKAIMWAGWEIGTTEADRADIISMSFGFARNNRAIRNAIDHVNMKREDKIVFLASAGNSNASDVTFPARQHPVIPVFATNSHGKFLELNARTSDNRSFGTFGDNIPEEIHEEFVTAGFAGICNPGSSVATAVMAGIGATMIAYAHALSSSKETWVRTDSIEVMECLRTAEGMREILCLLGLHNDDYPRKLSVFPMQFWKDYATHDKRYSAVYIALSRVFWRNHEGTCGSSREIQ